MDTAKPEADKIFVRRHDAPVFPKDDGDPQRRLPSGRQFKREKGLLPCLCHLDGEAGSNFAFSFRHGPVLGMPVNRGRTGVDPEGRRLFAGKYGSAEKLGRLRARVHNGQLVLHGITAVDGLSCQIDQHVRLLQRLYDSLVVPP
ncbi:hypothetical protein D3C77_619640 [compost metagenome]